MKEVTDFIKEILGAITPSVAALLIVLLLRKQILLLIKSFNNRLLNADEISIDVNGRKFTLKGLARKVEEQEKELKDQKREYTDLITVGTAREVGSGNLLTPLSHTQVNKGFDKIFTPGEIENIESGEEKSKKGESSRAEQLLSLLNDGNPKPVTRLNDPQFGRWGGKNRTQNREVNAYVEKLTSSNYYKITLEVKSTDEANDPLTGTVIFHLHDSFPNINTEVKVEEGVAKLTLLSYGSFVAGIETDNKQRQLEIDLATDATGPGVDSTFIEM